MSAATTTTKACFVRGSINVDEYFTVDHIAKSGETIGSSQHTQRPGGKGANGAAALAQAGAKVEFGGMIGNDATWLVDRMRQLGVGIEHLHVSETQLTGRAFIQVDKSTGENCIVLSHGSNHSPTFQLPSLRRSRYSHILVQNEIPFDQTCQTLDESSRNNITTIWNPSPIPTQQQLRQFNWQRIDWLILNESEAKSILKALDHNVDDLKVNQVCQELILRHRVAKVGMVVTLGSRGVLMHVSVKDAEKEDWKSCLIPAGQVKGLVQDTTGAGDCFTGYFVAQLLNLTSSSTFDQYQDAARLANQASAMCVEQFGTMESYPTLAQVQQRLSINS